MLVVVCRIQPGEGFIGEERREINVQDKGRNAQWPLWI
jgi:hypothetical protein